MTMKPILLRYSLVVFLALQVVIGRAADLKSSLAAYKGEVDQIVASLAAGTDEKVVDYLQSCLANVAPITGKNINTPGISAEIKGFAELHRLASMKLTPDLTGTPAVRAETKAYREHLQPLFADDYLAWVALQQELLERKYFQTETAKNANFLEAYVNGNLGLTRTDPEKLRDPQPPRPLGVSPWEAIFRCEPTVAMQNGPRVAILGTAGLSRAHFPRITNQSPPTKVETPASRWLKKSGVRLGVGAAHLDYGTKFIFGGGVQLNAVAVWGLYEPKHERWMLGVSAADLEKLKKIFGYFN